MKRRTLIAGAIAVAGLAVTENVFAQPATTGAAAPAADVKVEKPGFVQADIVKVYQASSKDTGTGTTPVIILKARRQELYLCIWTGVSEAISISYALQEEKPQRPMSADLTLALVKALQGRIDMVSIHRGALEGTFYSTIKVVGRETEAEVDSRSSDALALAIRVSAPILVSLDLLKLTTLAEIEKQLKQG